MGQDRFVGIKKRCLFDYDMRKRKNSRLFSALIFSMLCNVLPTFVMAQTVIPFRGEVETVGQSVEILVDSTGSMLLEDAMASHNFRISEEEFPNLGTTSFGYWLRLTLKNESLDSTLALQLTQPMADSVFFFQIDSGKIILENRSGHRMPFKSRLIPHQSLIYPISLKKGKESTIYVYIKSGKQLTLPLYLGSALQIIERAFVQDLLFGIYVGIILVMILYNFFVFTSVRDKNYLYYIFYLFMVLLAQSSMEGYIGRFLLPDYPLFSDMFIYVASALIGLSAIEFAKHFLASKDYLPGLHRFSYLFWFLYSFQILLAFLGLYNLSYTIMLSTAMFSALYVLYMAVRILLKGSRSAKYFLIAWSVFIACVVIYVLKDFNFIVPYNEFTKSALLIGSALEALLLSFALADRINLLQEETERIILEQNELLEAKVTERTIELQDTNQELMLTLDDLKQAQSQLVESEKMASLGQLTAGIAHEINNPINFVSSNINPLSRDIDLLFAALDSFEKIQLSPQSSEKREAEILEWKNKLDLDYLNVEIKQLLKGIRVGAGRTSEIVKGLKLFSRLDEDEAKYADILEGIDSTLVICRNLFDNRINILKDYGPLEKIECFPGKLNQVFLNLISNSVYAINKKFNKSAGGEIRIYARMDADKVSLRFSDNGIGMDEEARKRLFEPFFTTKEVGEGTGLGMSISYTTIKRHNGQISVESSPGTGTEFLIELPLTLN